MIRGLSLRSKFEIFTAAFLLFTPLFLRLADPIGKFRGSISAYVRMCESHYFGIFVTIAAMLFIINGFTFFSKDDIDDAYLYQKHGRWYNVILGISLLLVALIPYDVEGWLILHFIFAGVFFIGSAVAIVVFTTSKHKKWGMLMASVITLVLLLHFVPKIKLLFPEEREILSLLCAEWIGMGVISLNYILEAKKVISLN